MSENMGKGKLPQMWRQLREWWRQPGPKQLAEEKIVDDQARMVWADDGGPVTPVPASVDGEAPPGE